MNRDEEVSGCCGDAERRHKSRRSLRDLAKPLLAFLACDPPNIVEVQIEEVLCKSEHMHDLTNVKEV